MEYIHAGNNKQCLKWVKHSHMNIYIYSEKQETFSRRSILLRKLSSCWPSAILTGRYTPTVPILHMAAQVT